jgi:hypothetical protein
MRVNWSRVDLRKIVQEADSFSDVLRELGLKTFCGNFKTLKRHLNLQKISTDHFRRINKRSGKVFKTDLNKILVKNSNYVNTTRLKHRLLKSGFLKNVCEICGIKDEWQGQPLKMILDHINGDHQDHRIENLRMVCPNCNSQLSTNCGKNIKIKKKIYYCSCGKILNSRKRKTGLCIECYKKEKNRGIRKGPKYNCPKCKNKVWKKKNLCKNCAGLLRRRVKRPSKEKLELMIDKYPMTIIAKKLKVSGKAVKKWCDQYGIIRENRRGYWARKRAKF